MKTIKKAQTGVKQKPAAKPKGPRRTTSGMWVDEDKFRPPFDVTYADEVKPKAKAKPKKAKSGGSFPDLNKDGKVTKADVLVGRGVIKAKKGTKMKKAQSGTMVSLLKNKKPAKPNPAKKMMKAGGKMTKCKYGCK